MSIEDVANEYLDTSAVIDDVLEHHGVKGMRWGVRRAQAHTQSGVEKAVNRKLRTAGQTHREKKAARKDKKWQKNIYKTKSAIDIHNRVADKMNNGGLDQLNNSVRFAKMNKKSNPELKKAYFKAYEQMNEKFTREAVQEIHGTSPSGGYKATLDTSNHQWSIKIVPNDVEHAASDFPEFEIELEHDENGFITLLKNVQEELAQSSIEDVAEEFIEHFGVKGMKWGVRRSNQSGGGSKANPRKTAKRLSDDDLKKAVERLRLEDQYITLHKSTSTSDGKKFVHELLKGQGKTVAGTVVGGAAAFAVQRALKARFPEGGRVPTTSVQNAARVFRRG